MKQVLHIANQSITIEDIQPLFEDEKGWLISAAGQESQEGNMLQPRLIATAPAAIRGNHYHAEETEWIIFLNGKWLLKVADLEGKQVKELEIDCSKTPVKVSMPPKVVHAFKNISKTINYLFHYSDRPYTINRSQNITIL